MPKWVCDYCEQETNDLTELLTADEYLWVCPKCYREIIEEKIEYAEWLYGGQDDD
jgi:hypothetical protein